MTQSETSGYTSIGTIQNGAIAVLSDDFSHDVILLVLATGDVIGSGEDFPRFYLEQEPAGWMVYDLDTNTAYRMDD